MGIAVHGSVTYKQVRFLRAYCNEMCIMKTLRNIAEFLMILFKRSSHIFKSGIFADLLQIWIFIFELLWWKQIPYQFLFYHSANYFHWVQKVLWERCLVVWKSQFKFNLHKSDDKHQRKVFSSLMMFRQTSVLNGLFLHHKCSWYYQWKKVYIIV